jgi:hypothetical protein
MHGAAIKIKKKLKICSARFKGPEYVLLGIGVKFH